MSVARSTTLGLAIHSLHGWSALKFLGDRPNKTSTTDGAQPRLLRQPSFWWCAASRCNAFMISDFAFWLPSRGPGWFVPQRPFLLFPDLPRRAPLWMYHHRCRRLHAWVIGNNHLQNRHIGTSALACTWPKLQRCRREDQHGSVSRSVRLLRYHLTCPCRVKIGCR
jgi:hypothetical protein